MPNSEAAHADAVALYMDGSYADYNPDWHQGDSPWKAEKILEIMAANDIHPTSVCEIGCGAGEILVCLQRKLPNNTKLFGCEPSPQAFQIANAKANSNLSFLKGTSVDDRRFDLILMIDVIEHMEDYFRVLKSVKKTAKYFVLHIPLDLSVLSVLRDWPLIKRRRSVGHIHYFTKSTALASLTDSGYKVLDFFYTEIRRPEDQCLRTTLLRRLPLWLMSRFGLFELSVRIFGEHSLMVLATGEGE